MDTRAQHCAKIVALDTGPLMLMVGPHWPPKGLQLWEVFYKATQKPTFRADKAELTGLGGCFLSLRRLCRTLLPEGTDCLTSSLVRQGVFSKRLSTNSGKAGYFTKNIRMSTFFLTNWSLGPLCVLCCNHPTEQKGSLLSVGHVLPLCHSHERIT